MKISGSKLPVKMFALCLLCFGIMQAGQALSIPAKAWLSVQLINHAWAKTKDGEQTRPWPWMDSTPVAKITVPRMGKEFVVMRGVSGAVLAFMPGWHEGTSMPGQPGISLISAHRDTHFGFLRNLQEGDRIVLETTDGSLKTYRVDEVTILQESEITVADAQDESVLLLSTCYPFENWSIGGEMRFVVTARISGEGVDSAEYGLS